MSDKMLLRLLLGFSALWAMKGMTSAAAPPEDVLLYWTPQNPNGLSLRPSNTSDGTSLLGWWMGFDTANIEETSSGTTFSQNPFIATFPPTPATPTSAVATLDHVKHLATTRPISVSTTGRKLVYSLRMSAKATIPSNLPYKVVNPQDDPRLVSCAMTFTDFTTMVVVDILLTNTGVWILYERLPFGRTATNDYAAFSYLRRIATRVNSSQEHDLKMKYNPVKNEIEFWVDGKMKHKASHIGARPSGMRAMLDLGGTNEVVRPESFSFGFGCFTLLDGADPNASPSTPLATTGLLNLNPTAPGSPREVYTVPRAWAVDTRSNTSAIADSSLRLFGQGATIKVSAFKVSYQ